MSNQLDRILKIIQRTGDKVIVLKDDSAFVIASLDSYNQLVEGESPLSQLTESQMLDKINRDVATWKAAQEAENLDNWPASSRDERGEQEVESAIDGVKKTSVISEKGENSLNQADNDQDSDNSDEKYYFEPID